MKKHILSTLAVGIAGSVAMAQQAVLPAPLQPIGPDAVPGGLSARPDAGLVSTLAAAPSHVRLEDLALPSGELVDLDLERISVAKRRFGFRVDGVPRSDLLDGLDLSVWQGTVSGEPQSSVMLGFSNVGVRGWVHRGTQLVHLMPRPDEHGDWRASDVLLISEASLAAQGLRPDFACETLSPGREALPPIEPVAPGTPDGGQTYGSCNLLECTVAMETDFQLFQVFGDLAAETAYVTTLLSWISGRYEEQIDTVLTFPYLQFYTTSNDPWSTPDNGGNSIDMLNEFVNAWQGNVPTGATLAHFMSGASLGGGVAYLDVLCNTSFNFGVSGNIDGNVNFPVQQQPNNWDFMVVAHEIGHNFSTPHTHDFCPPLDECPPSQYFGQCQSQQNCTNQGTIMSYCHLCSGGTANITTFFHPTVVGVMQNGAQSCLPLYSGISGTTVDLFDPDAPTSLSADIAGTPAGPVQLHYRFGGGSYTTIDMTSQGGGSYTADVPAAPCDVLVEYYYSFTEASCGAATDPDGAPGSVYSAEVGDLVPSFEDDFETDTGWSAVNLGASSGDWQRGVPVDDGGWAYDPASDYDGSGSCWLTENQLGNTDVDDGAVQLTSPNLDLSGGDVVISYAYFLRLTNDNGTDRLLVEINTSAGGGTWTEIARHDTDGGLGWRTHIITETDLGAAGVVPSATSRLRFTANDGSPQSIVEAGLDAFSVSSLVCDGGIGESYCTSGPNSTGSAALISATGSTSVAANDLSLAAGPVPNQPGIFYYGPSQIQLPFGNGFRCVGGVVGRLGVTTAAGNALAWDLDVTQPPNSSVQITAGSTWNFQAWFRDPAAGGAAFDLSDGLEVTFTP